MEKILPLYKAELRDDVDGITAVSLVKYPAVAKDFITFSKEEEQKKKINFSVDEEKHNIMGCVLRANFPIYRRDGEYEYYVEFSKDTILEMTKKMFADKTYADNNEQHDGEKNISDELQTIGYFIKDTENGISPKGFDDVDDGSLFGIYHVTDEDLWDKIKEGKMNGFSVECEMVYVMDENEAVDVEEQEILNMIEKLKNKINK